MNTKLISQFIAELQEAQSQFGDKPVVIQDADTDWLLHPEEPVESREGTYIIIKGGYSKCVESDWDKECL